MHPAENIIVQNVVESLKKIPLLQDLPQETIEEMARQVRPHYLEQGDVLFRKGQPGDAVYIIRSGWVKIVTENAGGEELTLNHCGPGEVVGEISLIDGEPRSAGVVALEAAEVLELKREAFMDELARQPLLALDVMRNLSARLRFATTYVEKAIEWSNRIAEGDYNFAIEQIQSESGVVDRDKADDVRAGELLAAFFHMVEGVRTREETLKQQLRDLSIEIDEAKRREAFEQVAQSPFYQELKASLQQMRRRQSDEESDQ